MTALPDIPDWERNLMGREARGLPRVSTLRSAAESVLAGAPPPEGAVEAALAAIRPRARASAREQAVAAWLLGCLPLSLWQAQEAVARFRIIAPAVVRPEADRVLRVLAGGALGSAALGASATALCALAGMGDGAIGVGMALTYLGCPAVLAARVAIGQRLHRHVRTAAILSLGRLGDTGSICTLASTACRPDSELARAGAIALRSCLRFRQYITHDAVGWEGVRSLYHCLAEVGLMRSRAADEGLALAILQALYQVGGGWGIWVVEMVARSGVSIAVREEARRLWPVLRQRAQAESTAKHLLRPVSAPPASVSTLLRPAGSAPAGHPAALLRPAVPEGGLGVAAVAEAPSVGVPSEEAALRH